MLRGLAGIVCNDCAHPRASTATRRECHPCCVRAPCPHHRARWLAALRPAATLAEHDGAGRLGRAALRGAALFVATVTQSRPRRRQFGKRNLDPPAARGVPPGCTIRRVVDQHHTCHPLAADPAPQHAQHAPQSGTGALLCQHSERQAGQAVAAFDAQPPAAQIGHHHHIAGAYLVRYAQEAAWREDHRQLDNGRQVQGVMGLAMACRPSVDFCGYWQRAERA